MQLLLFTAGSCPAVHELAVHEARALSHLHGCLTTHEWALLGILLFQHRHYKYVSSSGHTHTHTTAAFCFYLTVQSRVSCKCENICFHICKVKVLLGRSLWIDHLFTLCSAALTSQTALFNLPSTFWQGFCFPLIFLFFLSLLWLLPLPQSSLHFHYQVQHLFPPFYPFTCCQFFMISSNLPLKNNNLSMLPLVIYSRWISQISCLCVCATCQK